MTISEVISSFKKQCDRKSCSGKLTDGLSLDVFFNIAGFLSSVATYFAAD